MNNRGQTGGLITALVFGIASLIIGVIIAFVIVSTLTDANLLTSTRTTNSVVNESGGYINETGYTLPSVSSTDYVPGSFAISVAHNVSEDVGTVILAGNFTVSDDGVVTNASETVWTDVNFTYTNTIYSAEELSTERLSGNFTAGVDNVSGKIPTVLLVAAIVLILGVLAILVGVWQRMRMGGGEQL